MGHSPAHALQRPQTYIEQGGAQHRTATCIAPLSTSSTLQLLGLQVCNSDSYHRVTAKLTSVICCQLFEGGANLQSNVGPWRAASCSINNNAGRNSAGLLCAFDVAECRLTFDNVEAQVSFPELCVGPTGTLEQRGEARACCRSSGVLDRSLQSYCALQVAALTAAAGAEVDHSKPYAELW